MDYQQAKAREMVHSKEALGQNKTADERHVELILCDLPEDELLKELFAIELSAHKNPWSYDNIKACFTDFNFVLAVKERGQWAGFAVVQIIYGEAELLTIGIKRALQGRGLGRILLNAVLELCKVNQVKTCFLEVREHNEPAKNLYLSSGFEIVGLRKNYYEATADSPAENAFTMRLNLQ